MTNLITESSNLKATALKTEVRTVYHGPGPCKARTTRTCTLFRHSQLSLLTVLSEVTPPSSCPRAFAHTVCSSWNSLPVCLPHLTDTHKHAHTPIRTQHLLHPVNFYPF